MGLGNSKADAALKGIGHQLPALGQQLRRRQRSRLWSLGFQLGNLRRNPWIAVGAYARAQPFNVPVLEFGLIQASCTPPRSSGLNPIRARRVVRMVCHPLLHSTQLSFHCRPPICRKPPARIRFCKAVCSRACSCLKNLPQTLPKACSQPEWRRLRYCTVGTFRTPPYSVRTAWFGLVVRVYRCTYGLPLYRRPYTVQPSHRLPS